MKNPYLFEPILYLEPPATPEEREIARLLEKLLEGYRKKDLAILDSVFHPEARIYEPHRRPGEGKFLDKNEFIRFVLKSDELRKVFYRDVIIRVLDKERAIVSYSVDILLRSSMLQRRIERVVEVSFLGNSWKIYKISPPL